MRAIDGAIAALALLVAVVVVVFVADLSRNGLDDQPNNGPAFWFDAPEYRTCVEATDDPVSCWNAYVGGVVAGWEQADE